jgi:uncharacterized protein (DUF58 family)
MMSDESSSTSGRTGWRPTVAYFRAAAGAIVAVTLALILRRPDLLVIATPAAVVAAWSAMTRPRTLPSIDDRLDHPTIREGDATRWHATLRDGGDIDLVVAIVKREPWIDTKPASGVVTGAGVDGVVDLRVAVRSVRWGRRLVARANVVATSPWGAFRWSTVTPLHSLTTLPLPSVFDVDASARPADGLVGLHRSTRAGEGKEFAGIRPFQAGDRMRRINWARSARSGELQVNSTSADLDTHVALLVDATHDVGVSEGIDGRASSLDATVRAAGAIAEHYALHGERVSLRSFGTVVPHSIAPGTGRTQLRRILDTLTTLRPSDSYRRGARLPTARRAGSISGQMTVMLSPLIAPETLDLAVSLGRQGMSVVVVDTLPEHVVQDDDPYIALAWRIRLLERRRELRSVRAAGIPVIEWRGPGSLDQVIRDIARRSAGPRMVRR